MYAVITLFFCAWISLFCLGKTKEQQLSFARIKSFKEQNALQKKAQQKIEKIFFSKTVAIRKTKNKAKKKEKTSRAALSGAAEKKSAIDGIKKPQDPDQGLQSDRPLPLYRLDLCPILKVPADRGIANAFVRLIETVYLPKSGLSAEQKKRFAKELIQNIKSLSLKKKKHFCEECLDKVDFKDFEMRLAYCKMLKARPSLIEFISFKKSPLYFYNLPKEVLEALFGNRALPHLLALQKAKGKKSATKELLKSALRGLGELDYEKEQYIEKMRFVKRRAPDKRAHVRISLSKTKPGLWRASPSGLLSWGSGIEDESESGPLTKGGLD